MTTLLLLMCIHQVSTNAQPSKSPKAIIKKPSHSIASKSNGIGLNPPDYDYYVLVPAIKGDDIVQENSYGTFNQYALESRVVDVRTGTIVNSLWPQGDTYWLRSRQKLLSTNGINPILDKDVVVASASGKLGRIIEPLIILGKELIRGGYFSPDFRQFIFQKEQDMWTADINLNEGRLVNPKQLTRFGFTDAQPLWGWYKNSIGLGNSFWIDLENGDVKDVAGSASGGRGLSPNEVKAQPDRFFSPDRRFALFSWRGLLMDLKTNKPINLLAGLTDLADLRVSPYALYWLNNRQLIFYYQGMNALKNYIYTFDEAGSYTRTTVPNLPVSGFNLEYIPSVEKDGRKMFSPDSTKYLAKPYCSDVNNPCDWHVVDPKSAQIIPIDKGNLLISWIDDSHLLYFKNSTGASEQGTYIFDIPTKSRKKLFSYTLEGSGLASGKSYYNFKSNYLLFGTQGILWRCRPDGSELTELLKEPNMIYSVKPFVKAIID